MAEPLSGTPSYLELSPELEGRFNALPDLGLSSDQREVFDQTLRLFFDPKVMSPLGQYTGASPEAVVIVQQGLLNSLEAAGRDGVDPSGPRQVIFPVDGYIRNPDQLILGAMQSRTDRFRRDFMIDDMSDAMYRNGRYLSAEFDPEHPDYEWVSVSADDHTYFGIDYRFFHKKPEYRDDISDIHHHVGLHYLNARRAPAIVSDAYPYYVGSTFRTYSGRSRDDYEETVEIDMPEALRPTLAKLAQKVVIETMADQFAHEVDVTERNRQLLNEIAHDVVAELVDPVEAREVLQQMGIFDDPEDFR